MRMRNSSSRQPPPGQQESKLFHRFGLSQFATRFPNDVASPTIKISGLVEHEIILSDALNDLPRIEQLSDFHCVTTWSVTGLQWGGVLFTDFYHNVIAPQVKPAKQATLVTLKGQDGARTAMLLEDLLAEDVLLADSLNGKPLDVDHGAPVRLVAPKHYGYKSVKYLSELAFREPSSSYQVSGLRFMDHPRARVAFEERARGLPGSLLRFLYRPLIRKTAASFARESALYKRNNPED